MSGFIINVTAGGTPESSSVSVSGKDQHIISDTERGTFKLNDSQLKDAVATSFGKRPNDAYLHSPTPWGDLYQTYNWDQTETVMTCVSADIVSFTSEPVIVKQQTFKNSSSQTGVFKCAISEEVSETSTNSWSTGGSFTASQMIEYKIGFLGTGGGGETTMEYTQSWGKSSENSKTTTVGQTSGVKVTLEPGESVIASLSASRGVMNIKIRYQAVLTGQTAVNYNPTYKGHHFWGLWLPSVMADAGITNKIYSEEMIKVDYYSNGEIKLMDPQTKTIMKSFKVADPSSFAGLGRSI